MLQKWYLEGGGHSGAHDTHALIPGSVDVIDVDELSDSEHWPPLIAREGSTGSLPVAINAGVAKCVPDRTSHRLRIEMASMVLCLYGVGTAMFCGPVLAVWDHAGLETFEWPPNGHKTSLLLLNAVLDSTYNGLLLFGILVTTPLFMSVGTMLVMPASIVVDRLVHGTVLSPLAVVGAVVIVVGFGMLNIPPHTADRWGAGVWARCARS